MGSEEGIVEEADSLTAIPERQTNKQAGWYIVDMQEGRQTDSLRTETDRHADWQAERQVSRQEDFLIKSL